jgi:predicted nicotinamide N-methyase
MAKYLERQAGRPRGDWSRSALKGKRAVELGAGMGLGGMALALLGCDVMLTDVAEVLPLLRRNAAQVRPEALRAADGPLRGADVGRAEVRELDWAVAEHAERAKAEAAAWAQQAAEKRASSRSRSRRRRRSSSGAGGGARRASLDQQQASAADPAAADDAPPSPPPPFDAILAADCVYSEGAIPIFLSVVLALSGRQTSILVANERRSHTICDAFERAFGEHFALKRIPYAKLDPEHRHPLIELWQLKRKRAPAQAGAGVAAEAEEEEVVAGALLEGLTLREEDEDEGDRRSDT